MISPGDAFISAIKCYDGDCRLLQKKAFDDGTSWVFLHSDEVDVEDGGWPVSVDKLTGIAKTLPDDDAFEFWDRCDSLPTVEVSL